MLAWLMNKGSLAYTYIQLQLQAVLCITLNFIDLQFTLVLNTIIVVTPTTPSLIELHDYVTPHYASMWKLIGKYLGLPIGKLNNIEAGWPTNVEHCCNQMLEAWLDTDTKASWKKMHKAIRQSARSSNLNQASLYKGEQL